MRQFLSQYTRPFTLAEIQPGAQSFSCDIAKQFDVVCLIIEKNECKAIYEQCIQENPDTIILFYNKPRLNEYKLLGECEHCDVAIFTDPCAVVKDTLQKSLPVFLTIADHTIFKIALTNMQEIDAVRQWLDTAHITFDMYVDEYCWLYIHKPRKDLRRKTWYRAARELANIYVIESNFHEKKLNNRSKRTVTEWIHGINMFTFFGLRGCYPRYHDIEQEIMQFKNCLHNDYWLGNIIMQGKSLHLIDFDDTRRDADFDSNFTRALLPFKRNQPTP